MSMKRVFVLFFILTFAMSSSLTAYAQRGDRLLKGTGVVAGPIGPACQAPLPFPFGTLDEAPPASVHSWWGK